MRFSQSKTIFFTCLILGTLLLASSIHAQEIEKQIAKNTVKEKTDDALDKSADTDVTDKKLTTDQPVSSKRPKTSILTRLGVESSRTQALSLNEAIRQALTNNNDIEVARNDVKIAESTLRSLFGFYEPTVIVNPTYSSNVQPQPNIFSGADATGVVSRKQFAANTSFSQFVKKGGGNYSVFFNNTRTTTSSLATTLNPSFTSSLGISYTQPIFRNRRIDQNRRQIKIQRKFIGQSDADFRRQT